MNAARRVLAFGPLSLLLLACALTLSATAATVSVNVIDFEFSPAEATVEPNDSVKWTWLGNAPHSSTSSSTPRLWDSGVHGNGFTFTTTFPSAGSFPYFCTVHPFMVGSINVQASTNSPPVVTITSPTNGATFAAPWTSTLQASASDADGSVTQVEFFANSVPLGSVSHAPFGLTVTNLSAGTYTMTAVATDNGGATNTSPAVTISVVTPVAIVLSSPQRAPTSQLEFRFTANAGLSYAVERSTDLSGFTAIGTNAAATSSVTFTDTAATPGQSYYRVRLLPNP